MKVDLQRILSKRGITMFIQSQYSDDLFDIYELVVTKNINEIENKYPELV